MPRLTVKIPFYAFLFLTLGVLGFHTPVRANDLPPSMESLQEVKATGSVNPAAVFSSEMRKTAQREAALSYGARGGLSRRTFEIRQILTEKERYLDRVFDFRRLLIPAPSGLLIEPPVIDESNDALEVIASGQEAAVADRIYAINTPATIVTTPRNWRTYLERDWGEVEAPPEVVLPENHEERQNWRRWVRQGWDQGYEQAEEIFQTDLDRLVSDYVGMARYRLLLAQGMISQPFALQEDRGITGGGERLRIGDRAVKITGPSQLRAGADQWQPADR